MIKEKVTMWQSEKVMEGRKRPPRGATIFVVVALICVSSVFGEETPSICKELTPKVAKTYWDMVEICMPCLATEGCGFCHSTLQCIEGDVSGPFSGPPCPDWLASTEDCPSTPECTKLTDCSSCAGTEECAWCASESSCMTIEATYTTNCRGTVFDAPCPNSYIGGKRYIHFWF